MPDAVNKPRKKIPSPTGARASNAGDEFHFRYSARCALRLLDPSSGLSFVQVEGAEDASEGQERFLAIDTTEYYGGDRLANSVAVVANQLKYSTTAPEKEWTVARLTASKGKDGPSLVRKLAQSFSDFLCDSSLDEVVQKLKIKLVSNQPAASGVKTALAEAKRVVEASPNATYADLEPHLTSDSLAAVASLFRASALNDREFCVFLCVLDLSGCGQGSLVTQDTLLTQEAGPFLGDDRRGIDMLVNAVRDLALPGKEGQGLTARVVVAALGAATYDDLFPARPAFEQVASPIETADVATVAKVVLQHPLVLAHGEAGIGKSTTVQLLEAALPEGSVVIAYDCWGAGECHTYGGARHTHARAIRQIINDVSVRLGLPLLVGQVSANEDLALRLRRRLQAAAEAVGDGLLVIAIDAADNAAVAGSPSEPSFVENLWTLQLPENCRLLMTARTHRQELLTPPPTVSRVRLKGFDEEASAEHLRRAFAKATAEECARFHEVTGGNPRLQSYKLSQAKREDQLVVALDSGLASLEVLFQDLLTSTTEHFGQPDLGRRLIGGLVCVPRPIHIVEYASAYGLTEDQATTFLTGLAPGIVIGNGVATLRDEDFDNYLRQALSDADMRSAHDHLATFLLQGGLNRPYAARAIAEHLDRAQRFTELVKLGLSGEGLEEIKDDLLRVQVMRRRLALALAATAHCNNLLDAAKLLLLACMATRSDGALVDLIKERPELAAAYGDPEAVAKVLLRHESEPWYGPAHLRAAALCARNEATHSDAERHLHEGQGWLDLYMAKTENERHQWSLKGEDLSYGGQAVYFLDGLAPALDYMLRWRPTEDIVAHFFNDLVGRIEPHRLCDELAAVRRPGWVDWLLASAVWRCGKVPNKKILRAATKAALTKKGPDRKKSREFPFDFIGLAEARVTAGCDAVQTLELLAKVPDVPDDLRADHPSFREHEAPLRAFCLKALLAGTPLTLDALIETLIPEGEGHQVHAITEKRRNLREALSPIFPVYVLRAQTITGVPPSDAADQVRTHAAARGRGAENRYGAGDLTFHEWSRRAYETLLRLEPVDTDTLKEVAAAARILFGSEGSEGFVSLARITAQAGLGEVSEWLLTTLDSDLRTRKMPAREKVTIYLNAAAIAERFDAVLSRELFVQAVEAAKGVDNESAALVGVLSRTLAHARTRTSVRARRKEYTMRLARLLEIHQPFVSDSEHLPHRIVLESIASLWPVGGLVIGARWPDMDIAAEYDTAPVLAGALEAGGSISPTVAIAMLRLAGPHNNPTYHGLKILARSVRSDRGTALKAFTDLARRVLRDTNLADRRRAITELAEWAVRHNFDGTPIGHSLKVARDFVAQLGSDQREWAYESERNQQCEVILQRPLSSPSTVSRALADLVSEWSSEAMLDRFAALVAEQTRYGSRVEVLHAILDAELPFYQNRSRAHVLIRLFEQWTNSTVCEAATKIVNAFFERYALPLPYPGERDDYLHVLTERAGGAFNVLPATVTAVTRNIDALGPRGFYHFADLLATRLDDTAFTDLWDWFMDAIDKHTGEASRNVDPNLNSYEPTDHDALAGYLWKIMGYPSRPWAWQAIHTARDIVAQEGTQFVNSLISLLNRREAAPFNHSATEHLWMSARAMLLVLFLRLAHEAGSLLRPFAAVFADIALDQAFPHAQMRELARRIALAPDVKPGLDVHVCAALELANQPRSCRYPRQEERYHSRGRYGRSANATFDFDEMDTVPYWFDPLDRVFGEPDPDTLARADRWISTVWTRTSEECRGALTSRRWGNWDDTSNRHGSVPPVETLRNYLEYHAMMCAAGEMCDGGFPMAVSPWDDASDPWVDWLRQYLPAHDTHWISDLRKPTPQLAHLWQSLGRDRQWCDGSTTEGLLQATELLEEYIVLEGDVYNSDYSGYESVDVSSALVSPETAMALAAAIEGAGLYRYRLPRETDEAPEIVQGSMKLWPTVGLPETRDCLDMLDPLRGDGTRQSIVMAKRLLDALTLRYDESQERYFEPGGALAAYLQHWDDTRRSRYDGERGSHGSRLLLSRAFLLPALRAMQMDLIVAVSVSRNIRRGYEERKEHRSEATKAFILRGDGRIDPIRANCLPGTPDHP